jgi:hypothetical protein
MVKRERERRESSGVCVTGSASVMPVDTERGCS